MRSAESPKLIRLERKKKHTYNHDDNKYLIACMEKKEEEKHPQSLVLIDLQHIVLNQVKK